MNQILVAVLLLAPLVGFSINGLRFRDKNAILAGTIGTLAVAVSFVCSILLLGQLIGLPVDQRTIRVHFFDWMTIGSFKAEAAFVVDQISAIMIMAFIAQNIVHSKSKKLYEFIIFLGRTPNFYEDLGLKPLGCSQELIEKAYESFVDLNQAENEDGNSISI